MNNKGEFVYVVFPTPFEHLKVGYIVHLFCKAILIWFAWIASLLARKYL